MLCSDTQPANLKIISFDEKLADIYKLKVEN